MNLSTYFSIIGIIFVSCGGVDAGETLVKDDFSDPKNPQRRAARGDWQFAGGVASCTQDDELYKKFKDHGPIIFYDLAHESATISFQIKATEAKNVVFTANGEAGHVFRLVLSPAGVNVRAFPPDAEHKSIALGMEKSPALVSGEWTTVIVTLKGNAVTIKVGEEFEKSYEHPSLARKKTNLSVGFSFGALSVKDWLVTE